MTNAEINSRMDKIEKKLDTALIKLHEKIDPITLEMARIKGALSMIKWIIGFGFSATAIVFALYELLDK